MATAGAPKGHPKRIRLTSVHVVLLDVFVAEHDRLVGLGVTFTQPPTDIGSAVVAVFNDTCGNLVQLNRREARAGVDD